MAFGRRRQKGGGQQSGEARKRFVGREDLMKFFASFADEAENLVLKQAEIEAAVETGGRKDIERPMDDVAFRSQVINLRQNVSEGLKKASADGPDWFGPFDGWLKTYANEAYGTDSEFAKGHGDESWSARFIYIVLPGQVAKHNVFARWAEFVGMPLVETKQGFKPIYEAVITKLSEAAPKRGDMTASQYLEAKAKFDGEMRYFRNTRKDVEDWLAGKKPDEATKQKSGVETLRESIAEDQKELGDLRAKVSEQTLAGNDEAAAATQVVIREVKARIAEAQAKLKELTPTAMDADKRLERAANIVVDEPSGEPMTGGKPTVKGDAKAAEAKAGDIAAKIEAAKAEIQRLESGLAEQRKAVEKHEARVVEIQAKIQKDVVENRFDKIGRLNGDMVQAQSSVEGAKKGVQDAEKVITELNAEIVKLKKEAAKPPKEEKKSKRERKAAAQPTETVKPAEPATGQVVAPAAEAKTAQADAPPKKAADETNVAFMRRSRDYWVGQISEGNDKAPRMVASLENTLKALGG